MFDIKKIEEEVEKQKDEIINLLINSNNIDTLTRLANYILSIKIVKSMDTFASIEMGITESVYEFDITHYDKIIEIIQRIYFTENIPNGYNEVDVNRLATITDKYISVLHFMNLCNEMTMQDQQNIPIMSDAFMLTANRTLITGNIAPSLFYEYYKDIAKFFFEENELNEHLKLLEHIDAIICCDLSYFFENNNSTPNDIHIIKEHRKFTDLFIGTKSNVVPLEHVYRNCFIEHNSNVYLFIPAIFSDNYTKMIKHYFRENNRLQEYNKKMQEMTENLTRKYLSRLLPTFKVHSNVIYKAQTGEKKVSNNCELDLLIEVNDTLLVCEVKGGSIFEGNLIEDNMAIKKNISALVEDPYNQCKRFDDALKRLGKLEIKSNHGCNTIENNYKKKIFMSITLENMDLIATNAHELFEVEANIGIWNMSIYTLFEYVHLFDSECHFVNYMNQRFSYTKNIDTKISDELIYFGLYCESNDFTSAINKFIVENDTNAKNVQFDPGSYIDFGNRCIINNLKKSDTYKLPYYTLRDEILNKIIKDADNTSTEISIKIGSKLLQFNENLGEAIDEALKKYATRIVNRKREMNSFDIPYTIINNDEKEQYAIILLHYEDYVFRNENELKKYMADRNNKIKSWLIIGVEDDVTIRYCKFVTNDFGGNIFEREELIKYKNTNIKRRVSKIFPNSYILNK